MGSTGAALSPGDIVDGKYEVIGLLGEGGMGAVFEGENLRIGRRVAIKVLHTSASSHAEVVKRFEQEAQAATRVGSSHIVDVLDMGDLGSGRRFIVMEYLDGESLASRLRDRKTLAPAEIAPIAIQLLDGLSKVHDAGIVHRDLKPGNIFLCATERGDFVKILDFGVCKFQQVDGDESTEGGAAVRTAVGKMLGTPSYMAPEQADASVTIDHRADIYSVGVMLYRAVSGQLPFQAETVVELVTKLLSEEPVPLEKAQRDVDRGFAAIVNRAIARDPGVRYPTALEFRKALVKWMRAVKRLDRLLADFLEVPEEDDESDVAPVAPPRTTTTSRGKKAPVVPDDPTTLPYSSAPHEPHIDKTHGEWGTGTPSPASLGPPARSARTRWIAFAAGALVFVAGISLAVCVRKGPGPPRAAAAPREAEVAVETRDHLALERTTPPPPLPGGASASTSATKPKGKPPPPKPWPRR